MRRSRECPHICGHRMAAKRSRCPHICGRRTARVNIKLFIIFFCQFNDWRCKCRFILALGHIHARIILPSFSPNSSHKMISEIGSPASKSWCVYKWIWPASGFSCPPRPERSYAPCLKGPQGAYCNQIVHPSVCQTL